MINTPARELAETIRTGERSAVQIVNSIFNRIKMHEELNAFITVLEESARERAHKADMAAESGESLGPLHGVPIAIKDLRDRKAGVRHTMGLAPLAENTAEEDSIVVERLEAAGAVIVGTTNTPALGHTIKTDNRLVGATSTPFDYERSAGGSSGGSAAAVSAGLATLATGSDIGGSLRVPASCCNVVGLKPTFGRVPVNALDIFNTHTPFMVGGPIGRFVEDIALALELLAGQDDRDPFSVPRGDDDFLAAIGQPIDALSVAYSPNLDLQPVEPAISEIVDDAVADLAAAGMTVDYVNLSLPEYDELRAAYYTQAGGYFATVARRIEDHYGIDLETADIEESVHSTISLTDGVEAVDERLTNTTRTTAYGAIEEILAGRDALIAPTLTVPPYGKHLTDRYPTEIDGQRISGIPTDMMLTWVFNLTGHPVASVPAGLTENGLPVGLQIIGRRYAESDVLAVASVLERVRPWMKQYPSS